MKLEPSTTFFGLLVVQQVTAHAAYVTGTYLTLAYSRISRTHFRAVFRVVRDGFGRPKHFHQSFKWTTKVTETSKATFCCVPRGGVHYLYSHRTPNWATHNAHLPTEVGLVTGSKYVTFKIFHIRYRPIYQPRQKLCGKKWNYSFNVTYCYATSLFSLQGRDFGTLTAR
jgi:hypothetical protein